MLSETEIEALAEDCIDNLLCSQALVSRRIGTPIVAAAIRYALTKAAKVEGERRERLRSDIAAAQRIRKVRDE